MQELSPQQIKKLEKLAKVGDIAIADELNALESKIEALEAIVPVLREARDGEKGEKGDTGERGEKGDTGERGADGHDGVDGKDGKDGINGRDGKDGRDGVDGRDGKDGEMGVIDEATIAYLEDEVKKAKLDTDAFNRALGIVDQRTSFLINKVNNLPTATATTGSGITRSVVVTTGDTTLGADTDTDYVCVVNGAHTVTMPTAVGNTNQYTVKNNHSADITIDTTFSETIDGTTSIQIAPEDSVDMVSTSTNWVII